MTTMNSQLHLSNHNIDPIWWNPCKTLSRHFIICISLSAVTLIGLLFIFINLSQADYYKPFLEKIKPMLVNHSYALPQNTQKHNQTSQNTNVTGEDLKLYNTLQERAKNRSNRYYLHDFEYFRMIRDEFPQTESAARLGRATSLAPVSTALDPKDVLFIVMGSVRNIHKSILLTQTWLQWSQGNFFIFADAANASIPLITLPQLENKPTREDAQHRQLLGSQWLTSNKSDLIRQVKWFVFADDDTWVNVPALLSYLQSYDYRMLLSIGFIWDDIWTPGWSFVTGGGGIVLSQSSFMLVMPAIYTKECPFKGANDLTLMYCQKQKGVTKINSDRFFWDQMHRPSVTSQVPAGFYVGKVTFHYINNAVIARRMTCDAAIHWKWLIKGCNDTRRDDMPNLTI